MHRSFLAPLLFFMCPPFIFSLKGSSGIKGGSTSRPILPTRSSKKYKISRDTRGAPLPYQSLAQDASPAPGDRQPRMAPPSTSPSTSLSTSPSTTPSSAGSTDGETSNDSPVPGSPVANPVAQDLPAQDPQAPAPAIPSEVEVGRKRRREDDEPDDL